MIATVDNPSNAAEWALAEMVNRLVSLLSVLPQLKFWASYATGLAGRRARLIAGRSGTIADGRLLAATGEGRRTDCRGRQTDRGGMLHFTD